MDQHDVPFLRLAGGGDADDFPDVPGHGSGGSEINFDVETVFFVKRFAEPLRAFRSQRRGGVELEHPFFFCSGDQIIDGRAVRRGMPEYQRQNSRDQGTKKIHRSHEMPPFPKALPAALRRHSISKMAVWQDRMNENTRKGRTAGASSRSGAPRYRRTVLGRLQGNQRQELITSFLQRARDAVGSRRLE